MFRFKHPSVSNTTPEQKPEQSNRSTTPGGITWKKALAIGAVPLALVFGAAFQSSNSVPAQLQAILSEISSLKSQNSGLEAKVDALANKVPRKFYVTKTLHDGAEALSACAQGYHMAALREIFDTSNLRYDTDLGFTMGDSGFGAPDQPGWIRTGNDPSTTPIPGNANCFAWTSANPAHNGTLVIPGTVWNLTGVTSSPWGSAVFACNSTLRVWCVED